MAHIVFIHGIDNKPEADILHKLWLDALASESGIDLLRLGCTSRMVYWADVLYPTPLSSAVEEAAIADAVADDGRAAEQLSQSIAQSPEQAVFIAGLAGKFSAIALQAAVAESTPSVEASRVEEEVPLPWWIKEPLMEKFLRDVHHYLFNVEFSPRPGISFNVQDEIRRRFVTTLSERAMTTPPYIVISHSMGTVIAYDCLQRVENCPTIDGFMTIGSPLGLDEVQDKLQPGWSRENGFPRRTLRGGWTNVFDPLDPVAGFDPRLANDFELDGRSLVKDILEPNHGWWRHDIKKYLRGPQLRAALSAMLGVAEEAVFRTAVPESQRRRSSSPRTGTAEARSVSQLRQPPIPEDDDVATLPVNRLVAELSAAIDRAQQKRVISICNRLARELYHEQQLLDQDQAKQLLSQLRSKRLFKQLVQVADALIQNGFNSPQIRRQYAQGLIDSAGRLAESGGMSAALCILNGIVAGEEDLEEINEARGLIGRVHKQAFVNTTNDESATSTNELQLALQAYFPVYSSNPQKYWWHGINVVALLARAESDGITQSTFPPYQQLAREILDTLAGPENEDPWISATKAEAFIALGDYDAATELFKEYARHENVNAFQLNSCLRQLVEVWRFSPANESQAPILALLQSELMKRDGGQMQIGPADVEMGQLLKLEREGRLEKVFGDDSYQTLTWYKLGLSRCNCVARFETKTGRGMGTGFVVDGAELHDSLWGRLLVLTNAHVLSDNPNIRPALRSHQATVSFECSSDAGKRYEVARIVWTSPPGKLDATLVELNPTLENRTGVDKWLQVDPLQKKVYLIGHPLGGGLSLSLYDNKFLAYRNPKLHYRTPSEPGSSGSPVFDKEWQFIGLHHAGSFEMPRIDGQPGTIEANEGISLHAIRAAIAESFRVGGTAGTTIAAGTSDVIVEVPATPGKPLKSGAPRARAMPAPIVNYHSIVGMLGGAGASVTSEGVTHAGLATAREIVEEAAAEVVSNPHKRAALIAEFTSALADLAHETAAEGSSVLTSPRNRFASIMQTVVAQQAQTHERPIFEFAFDKDDTKEALKEVFAAAKNRKKHDPLHPASADPDPIADDARIFLVSDFGTGMYGAPVIATTIAASERGFELLMHLGDIYYSGETDEVQTRFLNLWPTQAGRISRNLNGNHDMYSGGYGYFDNCLPAFAQEASYFALQNDQWLLVCLDTAYKDNNIGKTQLAWFKEVLSGARERKVILFSHHPLFSNFKEQGEKLEEKLHGVLKSQRIKAWYWGHEHHCTVYQRHPVYGFHGRCLGHGGMPYKRNKIAEFPVDAEFSADLNPGELEWRKCVGVLTPTAHYLDGPNPYVTDAPNKYGPHGYMTLEFNGGSVTESICDASGNAIYRRELS